jgi:pimeloyl-ACP methyl ester carboxylesterase
MAVAFCVESIRMQRLRAIAPPGEIYTIGGREAHLYCSGAGSPTLLLEAGLGDDFLSWRRVQPALSRITRVCSYDRAGYGWSSPLQGTRDTDHFVAELHDLVAAAHIDGPVVLMGHSMGGLVIRKYATVYPQGLVGMVFIDASTPSQTERLPKEFNVFDDYKWDKLLHPFGITRWRGHCGETDPQTPQYRGLLEYHDCTAQTFDTEVEEERDFRLSAHEAMNTGPFGQIPILIFSQDPALHFGEPFSAAVDQQAAGTWYALQEELKQLSPRSRRIVARGSTHYVHQLRPELVIREVSHMIAEIRGEEPARSDYGSTTTQ